ncbi:hypothetical protein D3C76_1339350 [compost metagenome]
MHFHGLGDIRQHHGLHKFCTLFKERLLLFDNTAGHLEQRVVPAFQAFDQPLRFLQIAADILAVGIVAHRVAQCRILLIDFQPWDAVCIKLYHPLILHLAHQHVRDHILGFTGIDRLTRARIERVDQHHRFFQCIFF